MIHFLLYLLKNGTLHSTKIDFEKQREEVLKTLPETVRPAVKRKNFYRRLRDGLSRNRIGHSIISNVAYIKSARRISRQFFFVDPLSLCYVRIFKSASTSILKTILPYLDVKLKDKALSDEQLDTLATHYIQHKTNEQHHNYVFFTIVRNPFQRLVSVYLDLFDPKSSYFSYDGYLFGILKPQMNFSQFVEAIAQIPDRLKSPHFASQYQIIQACGGLNTIHYFRIEKDRTSLDHFLLSYGITLGHQNKQKTEYNYRSFYDLKTASLARDIYLKDIEEFNYQEEYQELISHLENR